MAATRANVERIKRFTRATAFGGTPGLSTTRNRRGGRRSGSDSVDDVVVELDVQARLAVPGEIRPHAVFPEMGEQVGPGIQTQALPDGVGQGRRAGFLEFDAGGRSRFSRGSTTESLRPRWRTMGTVP